MLNFCYHLIFIYRSYYCGQKNEAVVKVSNKLKDLEYINRHKTSVAAFSRIRKLTFVTVFILILKISVKLLQLVLNEFVLEAGQDFSVTSGAFTKARKKLKHTAYIEMNDDIIDIYYINDDIKRLRDYRILAFDGSKITLPKNKSIRKEFGSKPIGNQTDKDLGEYSRATFQWCYDVLNNMAIKSILGHGSAYEVDLAEEMLSSLKSNDLLIF